MKLLLLFLFSFSFYLATAQNVQVKNTPLSTIIYQLENDYGYLFSYKEADVKGVNITADIEGKDIEHLLQQLLSTTNLQFEILNKNSIILTQRTLPTEELIIEEIPVLCGVIKDQLTEQPLSYANVFIKNSTKGVSTNLNGKFQLKTTFSQSDSIVISYVGYEEKRFAAIEFQQKKCPEIALNYLDYDDDFIVVTDYLTDGIQLENNSTYTNLQPNKIGALPGQAEPDILQTIQFLPGASSPDGSASGINIRGGSSDQNLILWENIPIYHTAHYFGMISAFNPYIIDQAQVYRGGFSANYGGRISSVINLSSDVHQEDKPQFGAGVNFINAYTYGKLRTLKDKLSITYSLRRSITDLWHSPTYNSITKRVHQGVLFEIPITRDIPDNYQINNSFSFLDGNFKANYQITPRSNLNVAALYGTNHFLSSITDDFISSTQTDSLYLENSGISLSWQQQWLPNFNSEVLALQSDFLYNYNYDFISIRRPEQNKFGVKNNHISEKQLQFNNSYQTDRQETWRLGYQLQHYDVNFQITGSASKFDDSAGQHQHASLVHTLYTDFSTPTQRKLGTELGIRWTHFKKNDSRFFEPRLRLWYQPIKTLQLYANAGRYHQFLNQLIQFRGNASSIDTPIWVLSGLRESPILKSDQYQIGAVFQKKTLLIDIQLYHKSINGLTSLATNFDENISTSFHIGSAEVQGIDILLKKRWGKLRSWLSYSYSNIEHRFKTFFDRKFPSSNEQPHQLHWVNTYQHKNFDFALGWKLNSGTPYSLLQNFVLTSGNSSNNNNQVFQLQPITNEFNSGRLPLQHQMDASINYTYLPSNGKDWKATFGLSVSNIYNQENVYERGFFISSTQRNGQGGNGNGQDGNGNGQGGNGNGQGGNGNGQGGNGQNQSSQTLRYLNRSKLGFTPNIVIRIEW